MTWKPTKNLSQDKVGQVGGTIFEDMNQQNNEFHYEYFSRQDLCPGIPKIRLKF